MTMSTVTEFLKEISTICKTCSGTGHKSTVKLTVTRNNVANWKTEPLKKLQYNRISNENFYQTTQDQLNSRRYIDNI